MKRRLMLGMCAIATVAPALAADPPIGSRLGNRLRASADKPNEAAMAKQAHATAACIVNKRGGPSERYLRASDKSSMEKAEKAIWGKELTCYSGFAGGDFVEGRSVSWTTDLMRGMLAEQLIKRQPREIAALPAIAFKQGRYTRAWFAMTGRNAVVDEMSACLADTAHPQITAVLATEPYSAAENAAFRAITPAMGQCLTVGAKLTGNRQSLRAAFADALYQRLINPSASVVAVEGAK